MYSVEVLLSTYNGEKYIAEQINSILHQTMPNIQYQYMMMVHQIEQ